MSLFKICSKVLHAPAYGIAHFNFGMLSPKSFEPDKITTMVDGGLVAEDAEERGYVVVEQNELSES